MAHLGDRVAALVDDALDEREWCSVQAHLLTCEQCREAVRRERHLKSRMTCGAAPAPPASLIAALADRRAVAEHVARQERRRMAAMHAVVTAGGLCASLTVLGLVAGGSTPLPPRQAAAIQPRGPQPAAPLAPVPSLVSNQSPGGQTAGGQAPGGQASGGQASVGTAHWARVRPPAAIGTTTGATAVPASIAWQPPADRPSRR